MSDLQASSSRPNNQPISNSDRSFRQLLIWMAVVPLVLLGLVTTLCYLTQLDLATTHLFFSPEGQPFPYRETLLATLIYDYGPIPAVLMGVGCVLALIGSFVVPSMRTWRKGALFCTLAFLIGPAILINSVLKPNWGRPRPCDIVPFGGSQTYVPPGTIGPYEMAKSFPSGHASMGFVFLLPAFLLLKKHRAAAAGVFAFGFLSGVCVGLSRIAEGGHFLSDIAWSGAIVYFTGLALYVVMYGWKQSQRQGLARPDAASETVPFSQESDEAKSGTSRNSSAA